MLVKASDGVIEGNRIENSSLGGIIVTPELYWGEGDYVRNVTITGNSIRNVCTGKQCYGGLALGALAPGEVFAAGPAYGHRGVIISNNYFENISFANLWLSSADGVVVSNNTIRYPFAYPSVATCCPPVRPLPTRTVVFATSSGSVEFADNCIVDALPPGTAVPFNATASVRDLKLVGGGVRTCP